MLARMLTPASPPPGCLGWLSDPLPALDDVDGAHVDPDLPYVVDAHVHLFPDRVFEAIYAWFDVHGWPVRHKLRSAEIVDFLLGRGVGQVVALHYAHRPGMARSLNAFMAELVRTRPRVTGVATVFPGEPEAAAILREGFALGLRGVKLHCHVQAFAVDDPVLHDVYEACVAEDQPLVVHAGREPRSAAYSVDTHTICGADRVEAVLRSYPRLRVSVPHLGADELDAYGHLLERYDNLWLDTTMTMADYFPVDHPERLVARRPERVMYGTDFPIVPYAWDRELGRIKRAGFSDDALERILGKTAREFHRLALPASPAHTRT
jgi:predicted TIM-barrel fold metal-dependent hydrolase